jgi:hypothetical protein
LLRPAKMERSPKSWRNTSNRPNGDQARATPWDGVASEASSRREVLDRSRQVISAKRCPRAARLVGFKGFTLRWNKIGFPAKRRRNEAPELKAKINYLGNESDSGLFSRQKLTASKSCGKIGALSVDGLRVRLRGFRKSHHFIRASPDPDSRRTMRELQVGNGANLRRCAACVSTWWSGFDIRYPRGRKFVKRMSNPKLH